MLQKCLKGLHSKNPRHAAEKKPCSCLLQQECQLTDYMDFGVSKLHNAASAHAKGS